MGPRIAIIGAGPGGCMLARLLHQKSIPCVIFEGEASIDYRTQGGTLDLRAGTGLAAIQEAGLYPQFLGHARFDGEALLVCDKKKTTWIRRPASKQGEKNNIQEAPEIDRAVLRKMLLDSVPEGIIRWGHRLSYVDPDHTLHFENGQSESGFDIIVGADGAWSKTRNFLTSEKPFYSGLSGFYLRVPDAEKKAPEAYKLVNRGSVFSFSDGMNLNGQQIGDGSLSIALNFQCEENWRETCGFDTHDFDSVKKFLREKYQDWAPELLNLLESSEVLVRFQTLYMLPIGFKWEHKKGVTLLGDAAHLMTPYAGIGVNTAFYDAMLLAHSITEFAQSSASKDLDSHIVDYEDKMWANAAKAQEMTYGTMMDMMFTPGAPRTSIESYVLRFIRPAFPSWAYPLLKAATYAGYFIYKLFV